MVTGLRWVAAAGSDGDGGTDGDNGRPPEVSQGRIPSACALPRSASYGQAIAHRGSERSAALRVAHRVPDHLSLTTEQEHVASLSRVEIPMRWLKFRHHSARVAPRLPGKTASLWRVRAA